MIALAARAGLQVCDVGTAAGLRDRERGNLGARKHLRQHPGLQHLRAAPRDWRAADGVTEEASRQAAGAATREFLRRQDPHETVAIDPAVFRWEAETDQA